MLAVPDPPATLAPDPPLPTGPDRHLPRELVTATLGLLFVVLSIYLLDRLSSILQPLFVACFILYALSPIKNFLQRRGSPTWLAYTVILACVLALLVTLGTVLFNNLHRLDPANLAAYEGKLDAQLERVAGAVGIHTEGGVKVRQLIPGGQFGLPEDTVARISGTFFGFLAFATFVVVYLFFMLLEMAGFPQRVREAFGGEKAREAMDIGRQINDSVGHYISVMAFVSLLHGGLSGTVLGVLGVDFFLLWAVLIAMFNFVPYLGLFGVSTAVLFVFVQFPDHLWKGLTALALLSVIQAIVDNVIAPRMTGQKVGVSPLLVVVSLAFWGYLWGPVGLLLAVPLTVTVKIILEHIPATKCVAVLVKDK